MKKLFAIILTGLFLPVFCFGLTGKYGLLFDGINDYVKVENSISLNPENISIEAKIKLNSLPDDYQMLVIQGDWETYVFYLYDDLTYPKSVWFDIYTTENNYRSVGENNLIDVGIWYHLVGTYDGNTSKIYFNGVEKNSVYATPTEAITTSIYDVGIGARPQDPQAPSDFFDGIIDEVKIYNRALSPTEVKNTYDGYKIVDGLVGYWIFDEGQGTFAYDYSGQDNTGEIIGATWQQLFNVLPEANISSVLTYAGRLFSDLLPFISLAIGLPLGFVVIRKAINLIKLR